MTAARPAWLLSAALLLALPAVPMVSLHAADAPAVRLQDVDLRAFIQDVSRATGITFIVDTRVQGTVNVARAQAMSEQDLLGMLLAVLRANGLIAVSSGPSTYRIIPDDTAAQQPGSAANGNLGFATQVFTLQRVDARSAAEILAADRPWRRDHGDAAGQQPADCRLRRQPAPRAWPGRADRHRPRGNRHGELAQ